MSAQAADSGAAPGLDDDEPLGDGPLTFNGVNGSTGAYLLESLHDTGLVTDLGSSMFLRRGENVHRKTRNPRPFPPDVIERIDTLIVEHIDAGARARELLQADFGPGIARNPFHHFAFRGGAVGETVRVRWRDRLWGSSSATGDTLPVRQWVRPHGRQRDYVCAGRG